MCEYYSIDILYTSVFPDYSLRIINISGTQVIQKISLNFLDATENKAVVLMAGCTLFFKLQQPKHAIVHFKTFNHINLLPKDLITC